MASGQLGAVVRQFHRLFGAGSVSGLSEAQLLSRFVDSRDEAAFEAMVSRFGPMVLGVCRKLIDDPHLADDAFQAAFLVLARRAGSIRDRELLGNWLYGVTLRVARKARADLARRRSREKGGADVTPEPIGDRPSGIEPDLGPILHEELSRLPGKYRDPVVLCLLDGRTHEEAAVLLHWPVGTVKGRLSRAKDLLRDRLGRRGVSASVAALAASLARTSEASIPPLLLDQTVKAAMGVAAGGAVAAGLCSAQAIALSDGVVTTMILSKTKIFALGAAMLGTLATGVGVMARQGVRPGQDEKAAAEAAPIAAVAPAEGAKADRYDGLPGKFAASLRAMPPIEALPSSRQLALERVALAKRRLELVYPAFEQGKTSQNAMMEVAAQVFAAQAAAATSPDEKAKALEDQVRLVKEIVDLMKRQHSSGALSTNSLIDAESDLAQIQYELAKVREGAAESPQRRPDPGPAAASPPSRNAASSKALAPTPLSGPMIAARLQPGSGLIEDDDDLARNEAIRMVLNTPISMPFASETPLEDVIKYIKTATTAPGMEQGLPIYLEPEGLQQAEKTLVSPITFNQEGVKLKTSLRLILKQLDLGYYIREGLLIVTSLEDLEYRRAIGLMPTPGGMGGGMSDGMRGGMGGGFGGRGAGAGSNAGGGGLGGGFGGVGGGGFGGAGMNGGAIGNGGVRPQPVPGPPVTGGVPPEPAGESKTKAPAKPEAERKNPQ